MRLSTANISFFKAAAFCAMLAIVQACTQSTTSTTNALRASNDFQNLAHAKTKAARSANASAQCSENIQTTVFNTRLAKRIKKGHTHYIEFRVRKSPVVLTGHMFVVSGELGRDGRTKTYNYIGLFPKGGVVGLYSGIFSGVSLTAVLEPSLLDCKSVPEAAYRVSMTAVQYKKLQAKMDAYRKNPPKWTMLSFNCNDFAASLGKVVGLKETGGTGSDGFMSSVYFRQYVKINGGRLIRKHKI
jgi:hypothetical protein